MKMLVGDLTDPMMLIKKDVRKDRVEFINEKIYVFLWFWFVGVAIFSALAIVYRMVVVLLPSLRVTVICARALNQVQPETVKAIITNKPGWLNQVGDYWVIYLLSKNL